MTTTLRTQLEHGDLLLFSPHRYKFRRHRQVLGSSSDPQQIPNKVGTRNRTGAFRLLSIV